MLLKLVKPEDFIIAFFCQVDDHMHDLPKHPHATLWPSEVVTLGLLHALKGVGNRAFYRWLTRDYRALFPRLPERTRLFRLFMTHQAWTEAFLASPTVLGVTEHIDHVPQVAAQQCRSALSVVVPADWHHCAILPARYGLPVPGMHR